MVQPDDVLAGHARYRYIRYLSGGLFGCVVLAVDISTGCLVRTQGLILYFESIERQHAARTCRAHNLISSAKTALAQVAIKFIERTPDQLSRNAEREVINHSSLNHPHIVDYVECFITKNHLAIVMEYCAGETLWKYVALKCALLRA